MYGHGGAVIIVCLATIYALVLIPKTMTFMQVTTKNDCTLNEALQGMENGCFLEPQKAYTVYKLVMACGIESVMCCII